MSPSTAAGVFRTPRAMARSLQATARDPADRERPRRQAPPRDTQTRSPAYEKKSERPRGALLREPTRRCRRPAEPSSRNRDRRGETISSATREAGGDEYELPRGRPAWSQGSSRERTASLYL